MTWEHLEAAATVIGVAVAVLGPVIGWIVKWLAGKFDTLDQILEANRKTNDERHIQNLDAFEKIRLALARAGFWNGK